MLIGLTGKKLCGKDTFFKFASEVSGLGQPSIRIAFADKIKQSVGALLCLPIDTVNALKDEEEFWIVRAGCTGMEMKWTMRKFLQRYGTEAHREIFGEEFWINQALPVGFDHSKGIYFVTDVRFENEARRVRDLGGKVVRITRSDDNGESKEDDLPHASERGVPDALVDIEFENPIGLIEVFRSNVHDFMQKNFGNGR